MKWMNKIAVIILCCVAVAATNAVGELDPIPAEPATEIRWSQVGVIKHRSSNEISGMAASRLREDILWMANDGGGGSRIYAVSKTGKMLAIVRVRRARNVDWEDLSSFMFRGKAYLLIADVGDNSSKRKTSTLYIIEEPVVEATQRIYSAWVKPAWSITFRYEDGPRDCEAVAVDESNNRVLLLSKRNKPPVLYALPILPSGDTSINTARRLTEVNTIKPLLGGGLKTELLLIPFRSMPTAMDISLDGTLLALSTYEQILLYRRKVPEPWTAAIGRTPESIPIVHLRQAEALSFGTADQAIYITTEKLPAPILRLDLGDRRDH